MGISQENNLTRGAYHFLSMQSEDPILQVNNFLESVKSRKRRFTTCFRHRKEFPERKSKEKLIEDLKVWCKIIEEKYGEKPIIYTYYHYYKIICVASLMIIHFG